jgi:hypothetical protein
VTEREPAGAKRIGADYRVVAIISGLLAITCLTSLVIVVNSKGSDELATIALALAIITFLSQLIVFVVQSIASNAQLMQNQRLYGETQLLLTRVEERVSSAKEAVSNMQSWVMDGSFRGTGSKLSYGASESSMGVTGVLDTPEFRTTANPDPRAEA